jgi:hypothetical protein
MASVVEVKRDLADSDIRAALDQLCTYARQTLKDQLDRRFTISFTLCFNLLHLYLFDRSGVVGTKQPIDIHEVQIVCLGLNLR